MAAHEPRERPYILQWRSAVLNSQQTSTVKLCLLVLAEWANPDGGNCFPSISKIAAKASVNEKTVRRSFDQAEAAGFIKRSHRGTEKGWRHYIYEPVTPQGADTTPVRKRSAADTGSAPSSATCGLSARNVGTVSPSRAGTESTDLSITYPVPREKQKLSSQSVAVRFAEWWAAYPRKVARKKAEAIWGSRKLDAIADRLIADVVNRSANDDGWVRGYSPDPTTYLNQDRWDDDLRTAPAGRIPLQSRQTESKQMQGVRALEEIKRGLVNSGNSYRVAETGGALPALESGT